MKGLVFDIEEFAVFDGPGIRSVIFLKGCPLHCMWCHNPEGLSPRPQRIKTLSLCTHCGACDGACESPAACTGCGNCMGACPSGCIRIAGQEMEPSEAAARVLRHEKLLRLNGGGVTFSGGEPLMQPDFVIEARKCMQTLHAAIETSGYANTNIFLSVISHMELVIMDIKMVDEQLHRQYTGVSNRVILQNLRALKQAQRPFRIRIPLIPGVNDTPANMEATAKLLQGAPFLEKVELLPYNKAAGGKYAGAGLTYSVSFDEQRQPFIHMEPFTSRQMEVSVL